MGRKTTPSFITEIEIILQPGQEAILLTRLDTARQVYNAVLGESLRRMRLMKQSKAYQAACKLPKKAKNKKGQWVANPERTKAFKEARAAYGFGEYDLHAYAGQVKQSWIGDHLDINTVQKIATRAFNAVFQYAISKRGKPRFKGKNQFDSVEGKDNKMGIMFKGSFIKWKGLELDLSIPDEDAVIQHGLEARVKYVRLVRRKIRGKNRFYAQLVNEGAPFQKPKNQAGDDIVGLDIGPSTIAFVTADYADLQTFCAEIADKEAEIAQLQRQIERQRRSANPSNYEPDRWVRNQNGNWVRKKDKIKPGRHTWVTSKRMKANQEKLAELQRKLAAHRKALHGRLVNEILAYGRFIQTEKLSYKAFQKMFGKSVGKRAPGTFVSLLKRKAESAGGWVDEFSTRTTRLSQTCICGTLKKKSLNDRFHICDCGIVQQRDLFSAFLARCVEDDRLAAGVAKQFYPEIDNALRAAASRNKSVIGQALPAELSLESLNGSSATVSAEIEIQDVVTYRQLSLLDMVRA